MMSNHKLDPMSRGKRSEISETAHINDHKIWHNSLDMLVADFIDETGKYPSQTSILDLMIWSSNQCRINGEAHK